MFLSWNCHTILLMQFVLLTHHVTSEPPFRGSGPVENVMVSMLKIQQVKERILRGLNMTTAPQRPQTTRMLTPEGSKVKKPTTESVDRQGNVSIIFSESTDNERTDTLSFKLDSRVRDNVQDIQVAFLVVRLRYCHNLLDETESSHQFSNLSRSGSEKMQQCSKNKQGPVVQPDNTLKNMQENTSLLRNSTVIFSESDSNSRNARGNRQHRASGNMGGKKPWRVKVVFKVVDSETGRMRRLAVKSMRLKRTSTMAVALSKEVLVHAATTSNHELLLQMTCKRCQGRVQIENVFKTPTRKNKKHKRKTRLNPNRPYLFIKTGNSIPGMVSRDEVEDNMSESLNEIPHTRSKRLSNSNPPMEFHSETSRTKSDSSASSNKCCSQKIEVNFHQLGLDFVLYPDTCVVVLCAQWCSDMYDHNLKNFTLPDRRESRSKLNNKAWLTDHKNWLTDPTTLPTDHKTWPTEMLNCTHSNLILSSLLSPDVRSLKTSKESSSRRKRLAPSVSGSMIEQCVLMMFYPIDVVYIDDSDKVQVGKIDGVVYKSCVCFRRR